MRKIGGSKRKEWFPDLELDLLRDICCKSFWTFFLWGFGAGANPKGEKWIDPFIHKPLADWFQFHVEQWEQDRELARLRRAPPKQTHLAIIVHREVGKTTMITQAGQAWLHLRDPEISTFTGSEKLEMASDIIGPIKAVMDGSDPYSLWTQLYGNWATSARTWKTSKVVHAMRRNTARRDASLGVFGVETSIVGSHPDGIFRDDPISYDRLKTDIHWLQAVNDQTTSLIPVIQADGLWCDVGTRYGSSDHFGVALDSPLEGGDGIATLSGMETDSMQVHENGLWHVYFMAGRDMQGKPTTPKVWPEKRLKDYQRRDALRYAAQVMNDPNVSEFNPITRDQLRQCVIPQKEVPWAALNYALLCDLALWDGKQRISKDESVWQVWGYPRNGSGDVYFIEGDSSMYWRSEEFANKLVAVVQRYRRQGRRVTAITNDKPTAGLADLWSTTLANHFADVNEPKPRHLEIVRGGVHGVKEQRISASVDFWVDGHVKLVEGAPGLERLIEQMSRVGEMQIAAAGGRRSRRNDWADTQADAFHRELYQPMHRIPQQAPWDRGARPIGIEGLDTRDFDDEPQSPRPPLR